MERGHETRLLSGKKHATWEVAMATDLREDWHSGGSTSTASMQTWLIIRHAASRSTLQQRPDLTLQEQNAAASPCQQ